MKKIKKETKVLLSEEEKNKLISLLKKAPRKVNIVRRREPGLWSSYPVQLKFSRKLNKLQYDVQQIDIKWNEFADLKPEEDYSLEDLGIPEETTGPEEQRIIDFLEERYQELKTEYLNICSKYDHIKVAGKLWRKMAEDRDCLKLRGQMEGLNIVLTGDLRDIQKANSRISNLCKTVKESIAKTKNAKTPEGLPYNQWEWRKNFPFNLKTAEELQGCLVELKRLKKSIVFCKERKEIERNLINGRKRRKFTYMYQK